VKSRSKTIIGVGGVLVALVAGRIGLELINAPSDEQLIKEALNEAITRSKEGSPGGLLDFMSDTATVNNIEIGGMKGSIVETIRRQKPEVAFKSLEPKVNGNDATLVSPATVKLGVLNFSKTFDLPNVTIAFKKEEERTWYLVPKKSWKITNLNIDWSGIEFPGL
jgi:hypothetical protein